MLGTNPEATPTLSLSVPYLLRVLPGAVHHLLCWGSAGWLEVLPANSPPVPAPGPGAEESLGEVCAHTEHAGWRLEGTAALGTTAALRGQQGGQCDRLET